MTSRSEKGGGAFTGIKLLLCENPLPPLKAQNILLKSLNDPALGRGFISVTTALPEDNTRFVAALQALLKR